MHKFSKTMALALFVSAPLSVPAFADGETDDLDVTVSVVEADGSVEDVVNVIELPEEASEVARETSAFGLATANAARQRGDEDVEEEIGDVEEELAGELEEAGETEAVAGEVAAQAADQAREAVKNAEEAAQEAAKNANEAAEEALKNALSGGAGENVPEDVLDNIPEDVRERLPFDPESVVDEATDNIPDGVPGT